jgi:hypothetical protein
MFILISFLIFLCQHKKKKKKKPATTIREVHVRESVQSRGPCFVGLVKKLFTLWSLYWAPPSMSLQLQECCIHLCAFCQTMYQHLSNLNFAFFLLFQLSCAIPHRTATQD